MPQQLKEYHMKTSHKNTLHTSVDKVLVIGCLSIALALTGCEDKGTTARAERKIDQEAVTAGEKFDSVADESIGKVDEIKNDSINATEGDKDDTGASGDTNVIATPPAEPAN